MAVINEFVEACKEEEDSKLFEYEERLVCKRSEEESIEISTHEYNVDEDVDLDSLRHRPHSYRSHKPEDYAKLLDPLVHFEDERPEGTRKKKADIRRAIQRIESGRFEPILEEAHKMYVALDPDEAKDFWLRNKDLMDWVQVYAASEGLNRLEKGRIAGRPDSLPDLW